MRRHQAPRRPGRRFGAAQLATRPTSTTPSRIAGGVGVLHKLVLLAVVGRRYDQAIQLTHQEGTPIHMAGDDLAVNHEHLIAAARCWHAVGAELADHHPPGVPNTWSSQNAVGDMHDRVADMHHQMSARIGRTANLTHVAGRAYAVIDAGEVV